MQRVICLQGEATQECVASFFLIFFRLFFARQTKRPDRTTIRSLNSRLGLQRPHEWFVSLWLSRQAGAELQHPK
jgi:hypothetical protein